MKRFTLGMQQVFTADGVAKKAAPKELVAEMRKNGAPPAWHFTNPTDKLVTEEYYQRLEAADTAAGAALSSTAGGAQSGWSPASTSTRWCAGVPGDQLGATRRYGELGSREATRLVVMPRCLRMT